jgi:uncharacterized cupin superfamily protein
MLMPKIAIDTLPVHASSAYPAEYRKVVDGRARRRLGDAVGLTQFGVNLTTLKPGAATSLRHWHANEDELVYVLAGELVLVEDEGETVLRAGDAAGWKAGVRNGHHLINRTGREAVLLEIGSRSPREHSEYSDVDMIFDKDEHGARITRRSGEPYA